VQKCAVYSLDTKDESHYWEPTLSESPSQSVTALLTRQKLLGRGESLIALLGIALAAILMLAMGAAGWWTLSNQRESLDTVRRDQVRSATGILAQSAESMLGSAELSDVRRLAIDAKLKYGLSQCRIVLPDGAILVDADPTKITCAELPKNWPSGPIDGAAPAAGTTDISLSIPLVIPGHGGADLQIVAPAIDTLIKDRQIQFGLALIGAGGLAALLLVYRYLRSRLLPLSLIRDGLIAIRNGETSRDVLAMNVSFGPEALAWNELLSEADRLRKAAVADRAKDSIEQRRGGSGALENACDALAVGLIVLDDDAKVKHANGAAAVLLQARREELTGGEVSKYIEHAELTDAIKTIASGNRSDRKTIEIERSELHGGGVMRVSVRPLRREDERGALVTIEDITQQRVAEAARNSFVATATHELRTPLTNMRLYLEAALEDGEKDPQLMSKCLNILNTETRRLERLVGEMLSVSEIEAGSLKIRNDDVRLDKIFEELQADYTAQAKEKKLSLTFDLPPKFPVILGDRDKLMMTLHNLLGNALKYTPHGGKVSVLVRAEPKRLVVDFSDTGIGVNEKELALIFDKFYRAKDPRVAKITGTGLGLALAREVARLHGGEITVQSTLDQGSTFTLTIPIAQAVAQAA
jgi:PAS domain S-box-containing protein